MGIFSFLRNWAHNRRARKELAAIDHLRRALESEKKEIEPLLAIVGEIEVALNAHDFPKAERLVPSLVSALQRKRVTDQLEGIDERVFERTLLRDLLSQIRGVR